MIVGRAIAFKGLTPACDQQSFNSSHTDSMSSPRHSHCEAEVEHDVNHANTVGKVDVHMKRSDSDEYTGTSEKRQRPKFLPLTLSGDEDISEVKKKRLEDYLSQQPECFSPPTGLEPHFISENESVKNTKGEEDKYDGGSNGSRDDVLAHREQYTTEVSKKPTETAFFRDEQEIMLNDGDDGLSTDYRVRCVFSSIKNTLRLFTFCYEEKKANINGLSNIQMEALYRDVIVAIDTTKDAGTLYRRLIDTSKKLVFELDTSKKWYHVVNHLDPLSCCLSKERIRDNCYFNAFSKQKDYDSIDCNMAVRVKLIFLGNVKNRIFSDSNSTVSNVELSNFFGSYFYECLESIYDYCFEMIQKEMLHYKIKIAGKQPSDSNNQAGIEEFVQRFDRLTRRSDIRITGTTGKANAKFRLRYFGYDSTSKTMTNRDPIEEVDALFVSSFIRFRINQTGEVSMDVYTRDALQLEPADDEVNSKNT